MGEQTARGKKTKGREAGREFSPKNALKSG